MKGSVQEERVISFTIEYCSKSCDVHILPVGCNQRAAGKRERLWIRIQEAFSEGNDSICVDLHVDVAENSHM